MPRPVSPEGPWVTVPVRVRASLLSRIDAVRGKRSRSEWMRDAAKAALGLPPPVQGGAVDERPAKPVSKPQRRAAPGSAPAVAPAPKFRRCTHPGTRSIGGFCKQCDALVLPGGGISG